MKDPYNSTENRTSDLLARRAGPQTIAPPYAPHYVNIFLPFVHFVTGYSFTLMTEVLDIKAILR